MAKLCRQCNTSKDEGEFFTTRSGNPTSPCRVCRRARIAAYHASHKEQRAASQLKQNAKRKAVRAAHKAAGKLCRGCWRFLSRESFYLRRHNSVGQCKDCLRVIGAINANKRRVAMAKALAPWADEQKIRALYVTAHGLSKAGAKHHVDHIVPLRHPLVCGLHVEHNLQVIPASLNYSQNNRVWPDMP